MMDTMRDTMRVPPADPALEADIVRDLTIDELETVSGGCPCTTPCDCDKPSARHP
jgi:hypothetical protein